VSRKKEGKKEKKGEGGNRSANWRREDETNEKSEFQNPGRIL
jgi:hypothetical protein